MTQQADSFLGTGWHFPPQFTRGGADVLMVSAEADIHQSLQILFSTALGERVMQDSFGCDLQSILFAEINQGLVNRINKLISEAILIHEPRIVLDDLDVSESSEQPGLLMIQLQYTVLATNSRFNMVYPFYLEEAAVPV